MNDREDHREHYQLQLDEWKAEIAELKTWAARAKGEARAEMNNYLRELEQGVHDVGARLSEYAAAGKEAQESAKAALESTSGTLKSGFDAAAQLKD
jgi:hypothetical protein